LKSYNFSYEARRDMKPLLFVYGTLMPVDRDEAKREGWLPDAVRGRLYDLGEHPALVELGDPTAGWVDGYVRTVKKAMLDGPLDSWEGVHEGVFRRVRAATRDNRRAWVYVYARPLPPGARSIERWNGTRRGAERFFPDIIPVKETDRCQKPPPGEAAGKKRPSRPRKDARS
jgi:gamma-glutamylcyclotransferase (GGCT)/AIG2-like uncharacterized protein YtfP